MAKDCAVKSKAEAEHKRLKIKAEAEHKRIKSKAEDDRRRLMQEQSDSYEEGKAVDVEKEETKTKAETVKNKERESVDNKKEKSKIEGDGVKNKECALIRRFSKTIILENHILPIANALGVV